MYTEWMQVYPPRSSLDSRVVGRDSAVEGSGLFARVDIPKGEVVIRWGGRVFSLAEVASGITNERSLGRISETHYIGSLETDPETDDELMNHSCEPNIWLRDEVTWVAKRNLVAGEELFADYGTFEADPDWDMTCLCRTASCRTTITGNDWKLASLQRKYGQHFSPFLLRWQSALAATQAEL